jgi:hypothetical protein
MSSFDVPTEEMVEKLEEYGVEFEVPVDGIRWVVSELPI